MGAEIESRLLSIEFASSDDKFRTQAGILSGHGLADGSYEPRSGASNNGYWYRVSGAKDTSKKHHHYGEIRLGTQTVPMLVA